MFANETLAINSVLDAIRGQLGLGENPANHNLITEWYNANVDKIGDGAWCEMTNTFGMWTGGAKELKKGRAYTVWAVEDAKKGTNGSSWHDGISGLRVGDEVYYDWKDGGDGIDHTGTVEKINFDGTFYALEGNYGNKLQRVKRDRTYVAGYVRFDWSRIVDSSAPSPAPNPTPTQQPAPSLLVVDGELGPKTIRRWQETMGTPADGVIDAGYSQLVAAVQKRLQQTVNHRLVVDGQGIYQNGKRYKTVGALQSYLGSPVDEMLSVPRSQCVMSLQRRLNEGRF